MKKTMSGMATAMEVEMKPCLHISDKYISNLKDYNIGDKVGMSITATIKSIRQDSYDGKNSVEGMFEISDIKVESEEDSDD